MPPRGNTNRFVTYFVFIDLRTKNWIQEVTSSMLRSAFFNWKEEAQDFKQVPNIGWLHGCMCVCMDEWEGVIDLYVLLYSTHIMFNLILFSFILFSSIRFDSIPHPQNGTVGRTWAPSSASLKPVKVNKYKSTCGACGAAGASTAVSGSYV